MDWLLNLFKHDDTKMVVKSNYDMILPNDIMQIIINTTSVETQLNVLPHVCHQFYHLTRPIHNQCDALYQYIPVLKKIINGKNRMTIVTFQKDNVKVCKIKSTQPYAMHLLLAVNHGHVDNLHQLLPSIDPDYYEVSVNLINMINNTSISRFDYIPYSIIKHAERMRVYLTQLSEPVLRSLCAVLIKHNQILLLHGFLNLMQLKTDLFSCFTHDQMQDIQHLLNQLGGFANVSIDDMISVINDNVYSKQHICDHFLDFTSKTINNMMDAIKNNQLNSDHLRSYTFPKERSLYFYQPDQPFSSVQWLEPFDALDDVYRWMGHRIML